MSKPEKNDPRFSADEALFGLEPPRDVLEPDDAAGWEPDFEPTGATARVPLSAPTLRSSVGQAPLDVLKRIYGYSAFRGRQAEVVEQVVAGGDAVVLFPTGAGKSLCFQIPALCRDGIGIVVSPLIALMRDQVQALKQLGVNAAAPTRRLRAKKRNRSTAISGTARSTSST